MIARVPVYCFSITFTILGIKFSCNSDTIIDINYSTKIVEIEKEMKQWAKRILTPVGRLTILKTLLLSKLNNLIISQSGLSPNLLTASNTYFLAVSLILNIVE